MPSLLSRLRFWRDHRWAPDQMSAYLDGELGPQPSRRMERHLGQCQECRRLIANLRALLAGLRTLPLPGGPGAAQIAVSVRGRLGESPRSTP